MPGASISPSSKGLILMMPLGAPDVGPKRSTSGTCESRAGSSAKAKMSRPTMATI